MSFSSEVKEEISKLGNLANKEIVKFELLGYLSSNNITIEKNYEYGLALSMGAGGTYSAVILKKA